MKECEHPFATRKNLHPRLKSHDVLDVSGDLFISEGMPDFIRSANGSEFTALSLRDWLKDLGVTTAYSEPGSPWENGYNESFNGKLRVDLLNTEMFYSLREAKTIIERWRNHYNHHRPHSSLRYKPPAPLATVSSLPYYAPGRLHTATY